MARQSFGWVGVPMAGMIIVADDHPLFREGVARNVKRMMPAAAIHQAGSIDEVRALAGDGAALRMLVLDLCFPGLDGPQQVACMRQAYPRAVLVVVSMLEQWPVVRQVMAAGANGFIGKGVAAERFCQALLAIAQGQALVCRSQAEPFSVAAPTAALTERQQQVLQGVCEGKTNKEIARALAISPFTVRLHVSAILKALGVATRTEAAVLGAALPFQSKR
ncbi:LuxR C-terminal-related transcriptional regulator [Pseudomonas sp. NPDC007930]|uniref:LuxR C-terminal-related transcriptional regulator n=1 Tax=Pseudomonas sp. NPDC007930 TaxID=3364417 RepID=UPI0036EAF169